MADAAQRKILAWIQQHPMGVSKQEFEKSFGPIQNHMKEVKALIDAKVVVPSKLNSGEITFRAYSERVAAKMGTLSPEDEQVLKAITEAGDVGIWTRTLKQQTKLQVAAMNKSLKRLEGKKLIKSVKSVTFKSRKIYMLYELVPSAQVTGGSWYTDGELDTHFINTLRRSVAGFLSQSGMKTRAEISAHIRSSGVSNIPLGSTEVQQVIDTLVFDKAVLPMPPGRVSAGARLELSLPSDMGVAGSVAGSGPSSTGRMRTKAGGAVATAAAGGGGDEVGDEVQRSLAQEEQQQSVMRYRRSTQPPLRSALISVPCGTCPVTEDCSPGGIVSPESCVYYEKWLEAF